MRRGVTCPRTTPRGARYPWFRRWQRDGTWARVLAGLQAAADKAGRIDWSVSVGLDAVTRLHVTRHDCDILVISAAREADTVRRAVRYGAVNYLLKPFGFEELRTRLEQYAARRNSLDAAVVSDQADVDRVLSRTGPPTAIPALPRGLSPETAELVEHALREQTGTLSAAECANQVGVSRVSARRYLEHYAGTGRAEVTLKYGTAGRPERRYRWAGR